MSHSVLSQHINLAQFLAAEFAKFPQVQAVALGGSITGGMGEAASDIDLYVFTTSVIPLAEREKLVQARGAARADLNLTFWDLGDEWFDAPSGIEVDIIYWDTNWITGMLDSVLVHQQPWMGYTTCFWRTVKLAQPLFDREGWFAALQARAQAAYPEKLRQGIIEKNHAVLRDVIPAYLNQIKKAVKRNDLLSLNHRIAALFASYFDILFAYNRVLHPGEKRLLQHVQTECEHYPENMAADIDLVLKTAAAGSPEVVKAVNTLIDRLEALLKN